MTGHTIRRRLCALAACVSGTIASLAAAGPPPEILCGEVITSSLDPSDTDLGDGTWLESYDFTLQETTSLSFELTAESFRPYIIVTDDQVVTVEEGEPPLIAELGPGNYTVFANNFEVLPAGDYPYTLSLGCAQTEVEAIACGQTVAGQLDPTDEEFLLDTWIDPFDFSLGSPARVHFQIEGDSFEPLVFLQDGDGNDIGSGLDEYTVDLEPGAYTIFANNFFPLFTGTHHYRLSMSCVSPCPGDCDGDGTVSIAELIRGVNLALGSTDEACSAFDLDGNGSVAVNELIAAVRAALDGCA